MLIADAHMSRALTSHATLHLSDLLCSASSRMLFAILHCRELCTFPADMHGHFCCPDVSMFVLVRLAWFWIDSVCSHDDTGNRHIAGGLSPNAELDVRVWDWVQELRHEHFLGLPQHCSRKYLLNWPGNSYSARLKYLLLCSSVVVHSDNGWYEFFYHMLKHQEHYIRVEALTSAEDLHLGLAELIKSLQADQAHSRRLASAGQRFARETLSKDNIEEYWHRLLHSYAALQNNEVILHHDAVPLGFSVSHPRYINLEDRHGCPQQDTDAQPHPATAFLPAQPGTSEQTGPIAS